MYMLVETESKKLDEWKHILSSKQYEALLEMCVDDYGEQNALKYSYSSSEVLDYLVQWEGGIASGSDIRYLIELLFNITLK